MDAKRLNRGTIVYKQIAIHEGEQNDSSLILAAKHIENKWR
jgi:hypothetical protein